MAVPTPEGRSEREDAGWRQHPSGDAVEELRGELTTLGALPVTERVARFEHANQVLAAALAELDEV